MPGPEVSWFLILILPLLLFISLYSPDVLWNIWKSGLAAVFPNFTDLLSGKNIPSLAVTNPTESIFVTSSYVNVPPIVTLPVKVAAPETFILSNGPSNFVAVIMPDECTLWLVIG